MGGLKQRSITQVFALLLAASGCNMETSLLWETNNSNAVLIKSNEYYSPFSIVAGSALPDLTIKLIDKTTLALVAEDGIEVSLEAFTDAACTQPLPNQNNGSSGEGSSTLPGFYPGVTTAGVFSFVDTAPATQSRMRPSNAGIYYLKAHAVGADSSPCTAGVTVVGASPAKIAQVGPTPTVGQGGSVTLKYRLVDSFGNPTQFTPAQTVAVNVANSSGPSGVLGAIGAISQNSPYEGSVTFTAPASTGISVLDVSDGSGNGLASGQLRVVVAAGLVKSFLLQDLPSVMIKGVPYALRIKAVDINGNDTTFVGTAAIFINSTQVTTVTFTSSDQGQKVVNLSYPSAGNYTIAAVEVTSGTISGSTSGTWVTAGTNSTYLADFSSVGISTAVTGLVGASASHLVLTGNTPIVLSGSGTGSFGSFCTSGRALYLNVPIVVTSMLTANCSIVVSPGVSLTLQGGAYLYSGQILVQSGGAVKVGHGYGVSVQTSGGLSLYGTAGNPAVLAGEQSSSRYNVSVDYSSKFIAWNFKISELSSSGIDLSQTSDPHSTQPVVLISSGIFSNYDTSNGTLIRLGYRVALDAIYGISFENAPTNMFSLMSAPSGMIQTSMLNIGGRGFDPQGRVYDPGSRLVWVNPYAY